MFIFEKGTRKLRFVVGCAVILISGQVASAQAASGQVVSGQVVLNAHLSFQQPVERSSDYFIRSKLIAADFASTFKNLSAIDRTELVFNSAKPSTEFGSLFIQALATAGFNFRWNDAQSSTSLLINIDQVDNVSWAGKQSYRFTISIGEQSMKREYQLMAQGVKPMGSMLVRRVWD